MKNTKPKDAYYINRIRLINFHNFVDELIEVRNGGHLFLLGDNGSGKTTVIDAVHYVLTAGQSMEFNSAARVVGRKSDGRRPQGIVSRYNVGRGHMNPDGAVTYAAVELVNGDRCTVLAVGMSVNSPEDNLTRWGIVKDGTLEEIPFMVEDGSGRRPAGKLEMRDALRTSYYGQISQYSKVVADRFVGGEETFAEFCCFLHMCKAYREIVSNSADYHSLFKKLLPEKRIDLFETIINALRDIETSSGELDELTRKLDYISGLESKVRDVREAEGETICFRYAGVQNNIDRYERRLDKLEAARQAARSELAECDQGLIEQEAEQEQSQKLLADLQAQDSEGLVEKEKGFVQQRDELSVQLKLLEEREAARSQEVGALKQSEETRAQSLKEALAVQLSACSRLSPRLPFSTATYMQALDELIHEPVVQSLEALPLDGLRAKADQAFVGHHTALAEQKGRLAASREAEKAILEELTALHRQPEVCPGVPGFNEAAAALRQAMVEAVPLYRSLKWAADMSAEACSNIEEAIGEEVLGTFVVRDCDWETACAAVLPDFPGVRLARRGEVEAATAIGLADWIRQSFDFRESDPEAMVVLHEEMVSRQPLAVSVDESGSRLSFRAHARGLSGQPARLIGEAARRQAQQRRVAAKEAELQVCRAGMEDLKRTVADLEKAGGVIEEFRGLLHSGVEQLRGQLAALTAKRQELRFASESLTQCRDERQVAQKALVQCLERLQALRQTLEEKGLEQLEEQLTACKTRYDKARLQCKDWQIRAGKVQQTLETLEGEIAANQESLGAAVQGHQAIADELRTFCGDGDFRPYFNYVKSRWTYASSEEFQKLYNQAKDNLRDLQTTIEERLRHPEASAYGFVYDRQENRLYDRHQCEIGDLVASLKKSIREQEEVINDKTTELFRNVIQNSLVRFIIENITRLRDMVKDINALLANRAFGMNRYRLKLTPLKEYERFVNTFQNFSTFNATSAQELQELLEDYKQEILNSEVNSIPAVLDYRNWFRYDMKVSSSGDGDGDVITRQLRSMGSGGEQAVPNYLLIMTIAHFLYRRSQIRTHVMLFDEAFYGIDEDRRNQLLGFAGDLGLQLFVASPDQDGVRKEIAYSTSLIVLKDVNFDVHLFPNYFENPDLEKQLDLFQEPRPEPSHEFEQELSPYEPEVVRT